MGYGKYETRYKKICTKTEIKKIFRTLKKENIKFYIACLIMAICGLRVGETVRIKLEDIHSNCTMLNYVTEKTGIHRTKPIPEHLRKEIMPLYNKAKKAKKEYLFYNESPWQYRNPHIMTSTIRWAFKRARDKNNLADIYYTCKDGKKLNRISPHTLRHYAASMVYDLSNYNYMLVSEFLGHTDFRSTARYITPFTKERQIIEKIKF